MTEPIERVARAIYGNDGYDICEEVVKSALRREARNAILALRVPTPAMLAIANSKSGLTAWEAMIDMAANDIS